MQAITVRDRDAGIAGLSLTDLPYPHAAENDVIVQVHAAGFTRGELDWPGTWTDRAGRDRTPSVPGHELSGVVVELGYGTTGLSVGQVVSLGIGGFYQITNIAGTSITVRNLGAAGNPGSGSSITGAGVFGVVAVNSGHADVLVRGAVGMTGETGGECGLPVRCRGGSGGCAEEPLLRSRSHDAVGRLPGPDP